MSKRHRQKKICHFFKSNRCKQGGRCKFIHGDPTTNPNNSNNPSSSASSSSDLKQKDNKTNLDNPKNVKQRVNCVAFLKKHHFSVPLQTLARDNGYTISDIMQVYDTDLVNMMNSVLADPDQAVKEAARLKKVVGRLNTAIPCRYHAKGLSVCLSHTPMYTYTYPH